MNYSLTWNLETIFPNGSESSELASKIAEIKELLLTYNESVKGWKAPSDVTGTKEIVDILKQTEVLQKVTASKSNHNSRESAVYQSLHP